MRRVTHLLSLGFALAMPICSTPGHAAVGWRHDGTGQYPAAEPAIEWSTSKNVIWKTVLPERGNSMPVIVGDRIFLNVEPDTLVCLAASDGKILWQRAAALADARKDEPPAKPKPRRTPQVQVDPAELARLKSAYTELVRQKLVVKRKISRAAEADRAALERQRDQLSAQIDALKKKMPAADDAKQAGQPTMPRTHPSNGYASPTPVSDGRQVYVLYGSGVVSAFDLDGNRQWCELYEQPTHQWGHSTSPRLVDGKLIIHIRNMMALDPRDGKLLWKAEAAEGWGTSAITDIGGVKVLATPSGSIIRAADGVALASGLYHMEWGSPIIHDAVLYAIDEGGGVALALPEKIDGNGIQPRKLWQNNPPRDRYYGSPIVVDGLLYVIDRRRRLSVIDITDGQILNTQTIDLGGGGQLYGSFSHAGGHLFINHENGQTAVFKPGRDPEQVAGNALEPTRSTPVFDGRRMFMRTDKHLYCIGVGASVE